MKLCWVLICSLTTATALLWPALGPNFWKNKQPSFTKICLYSNDPSQFTPMCIMCPNNLYPIVLTTCVMGASIPLNVSYTQANCIVGNCAVNMSPKNRRDAASGPYPWLRPLSQSPDDDDEGVRSVPYTLVVDGHNVTVTSVQEYFVHSDEQPDEEEEEEDEEIE
ncbi:uncharacterized protein LOC129221210 [Uloborus diversus]|uniref:uncharacterized protein LOC129221210 n=1 Tax=Uloborus diversus TaxID=327109 RepID=UPI002408F66E|nr:uncharacterized protein LOC129221210 [Uloborus diversus]